MTANEWDTSDHALPMLDAIDGPGYDRPLRAFACACCQPRAHLLPSEARAALLVAHRYAEGKASDHDLEAAHATAQAGRRRISENAGHGKRKLRTSSRVAFAVELITAPDAFLAAREAIMLWVDLCGTQPTDLLRRFVGNPFRGRDGE